MSEDLDYLFFVYVLVERFVEKLIYYHGAILCTSLVHRGQVHGRENRATMSSEIHETPVAGPSTRPTNDTATVQAAVDQLRNKAEKFDDMSHARVGLILFRYVKNRVR